LTEIVPDRASGVNEIARSVDSDERVRQVVFVGHVVTMAQVEVLTQSALPAHTVHELTTHVTSDVTVTHT